MKSQIIPCVGGVILDEQGRVLLVKHVPEKKGFWAGKYICPGGRLEYGETLDNGVRREVHEETGLEIKILRWLAPMERIIQNPDGTIADHVIYLRSSRRPNPSGRGGIVGFKSVLAHPLPRSRSVAENQGPP